MKQWSNLLKDLTEELGEEAVKEWLLPLKVVKFDAGNLFLDANDTFQINWFQEYVTPYLPGRFVTGSGKPIRIHFSIQGKPYGEKNKTPEKVEDPFSPDHLEPHATFEEYRSPTNENLPFNLLKELIEEKLPLGNYNPIYIYGPKGTGKSHLLMATAHAFKKAGKKCFYVRADTFTEHVIHAFRSASLQAFRKAYRGIEILIIDDVHLLSRKSATQEELFHTFNRLHTAGLQIILGSNVSPRLLEDIEERLVSRFEWGITLSVPTHTAASKKEILSARAEDLGIPLNSPLSDYFLSTYKNLHSLIQALEALALRIPKMTTAPDLEIVQHYLKDLSEKESKSYLTPEKVLTLVARFFGIKTEDILGKKQTKEQALPRQIAMYLCREHLQMPYLKIGRLFSRDHSTVMTSVKRVKKGLEKKEEGFLLPLTELKPQMVD